ncbi:response regulator [Chroococcidiopsis sp.]|uniref:response regulator n=1 Tax=Chroococcidiopsis sp. TaxID=3088168 RepID=UPI003F2ACE35
MSTGTAEKLKTIFLVEDNKADVRLVEEALKRSTIPNQVLSVRNGMDAIAFLRQEGEYTDAPHPDLILLDLNLPKKDGREVLAEIKADPQLRRIPVVILTTSKNEEDICHSYDLHVNCYITKSRNLSQLFQIVKGIEEFWLSTVTLPAN